ncbi:hypothetical protein ACLOJK_008929 [Asimina triloba]
METIKPNPTQTQTTPSIRKANPKPSFQLYASKAAAFNYFNVIETVGSHKMRCRRNNDFPGENLQFDCNSRPNFQHVQAQYLMFGIASGLFWGESTIPDVWKGDLIRKEQKTPDQFRLEAHAGVPFGEAEEEKQRKVGFWQHKINARDSVRKTHTQFMCHVSFTTRVGEIYTVH